MSNDLTQWIKRLKGGDQSAFLPFYEKLAPGLLRFLLWKTNGDRALSEDVLQEAFVRFLVNLDRVESDEPLAVQAYVLRIVKHCLIDKAARTPQASRQHVSLDALMDLPDPMETSRQESAVELRELQIAMKSLNEKDSEIIWLRDALGMSHKEVATQVGITEQASRQAYVRAKRSLFTELKNRLLPRAGSDMGEGYATPELS